MNRHSPAPEQDCTALVLQGGGALGAYQAGVYQALAEADCRPDWVAGISIGAVNAAIIAGNPPGQRVAHLRKFWELVSSGLTVPSLVSDGPLRSLFNDTAAAMGAILGIPGLFSPRMPPALFALPGTPEAISVYDSAPLRQTLLDLVDFDLINSGATRFSVGAVNVLTGNFAYFDNHERRIIPEHIMASGALPPGLPPVMIDGEPYWDGGLVSNTPLQYVLDMHRGGDCLVYQVDLFSAQGPVPRTLADVIQRDKDIRYSSRTRLNTDAATQIAELREAARRLTDRLPPEWRDDPDMRVLTQEKSAAAIAIMHLINRAESYETPVKDYEFSRETMLGHWRSGKADTEHSLTDPRWIGRARRPGVVTFDLARGCL
ncbi:MAG: patatin-like phospholipase family protein [Pseudomonadota bacterium]|nr:patatin-like phospholipase family protein [Pseudomonadota bacterium]